MVRWAKFAPLGTRGVDSAGMVCSADELGLSPDRTGIYVLDEPVANGTDIRALWADTVLDLYREKVRKRVSPSR